ncbi:MAG: ATP synthase F1 subunit delta [Fimbriimonadaceae bacterium]|nr:ATP synthase F1 subunit delta [Fimbriimonadaceae bacterium]
MESRVAIRYARALFGAADKVGAIHDVEADLRSLIDAMRAEPRLRVFLASPITDRERKLDVLRQAFGGRAHVLTLKALELMVRKGREAEIALMTERYTDLRRAHDNVLYVKVTSRGELPDDYRVRLLEKLRSVTGKSVEPEFVSDASMIGGIKVAYDNYVLDGTVRGRFARLRETLRHQAQRHS